MAKTNKNNIY